MPVRAGCARLHGSARIQSGDRVTVEIGAFQAEHLVVE